MTTPRVRKLVINGPLIGDQRTGAGVHLVELVRAMLHERDALSVVVRHSSTRGSAANRASAARIDPRVRPITTPVPTTVLRPAQARLRFPPERLLVGPYDVYHQFHTDGDPAVPGEKLVVTLHDTVALTWPDEEGRMYRGAGPLLRRAAAVITVSEFSKSAICRAFKVPPERVHVVHNGVDHDRFRPSDSGRAVSHLDHPYFLYVGGHTPRKNVARTIAAFARVREILGRGDLRLVLAGPVSAAEAQLRAGAPSGLPLDSLSFLGHVSDPDVVELYRSAEALLCPSLYEGFGMPALEAMACGTPVVASNTSALGEIAGRAAAQVDPADVDAIATGIADLLRESEAERARRRQLGIEHAAGFTWQRAASAVLAIYDQVAANRKRRR